MGVVGCASATADPPEGVALTDAGDEAAGAHRAFAKAAFNAAWDLIDASNRTDADNRQMLTLAFASRWHWGEIGTAENVAVSDWQVAHVASLVGESRLALSFATAAYDAARANDLPEWLRASTAEGLARAHATAGDVVAYEHYAAEARALLEGVEEEEDRELITAQLASIPAP